MDCNEEVVCHGDRVRVEQIVWNLLSNAVKFTPEGGRISVRVQCRGDFAKLTVTDTGLRHCAEFLPHVFGMFNQATGDAALPNGGLGIGLALVHELTLAHGGRVQVSSAGVGQGAEFTYGCRNRPRPKRCREKQHADINFNGWRVLAVDDYVDALTPFAEVLRLEGAVVHIADSAQKGLDAAREQQLRPAGFGPRHAGDGRLPVHCGSAASARRRA
jgi:two-component system CheB/CheR fusion protein